MGLAKAQTALGPGLVAYIVSSQFLKEIHKADFEDLASTLLESKDPNTTQIAAKTVLGDPNVQKKPKVLGKPIHALCRTG